MILLVDMDVVQFQVPIKCVQQKLYVRISAHIYNELADYEQLCNAVLKLNEESPR